MINNLKNHYNINNIQKYWEVRVPFFPSGYTIYKHYFHWCQRKITTISSLNNSKCIRIITSGYYKVEVN